MKQILFLSLLTLFSCSETKLVQKAKRINDRLSYKYPDAAIPLDTITKTIEVTKTDTLVEIDTVDNYIRITNTILDTVFIEKLVYLQPDFSGLETNSQTRQRERTKRNAQNNETKQTKSTNKATTKQVKSDNKTDVKNNRIDNRSGAPWWVVILLLIITNVCNWILHDKMKGL